MSDSISELLAELAKHGRAANQVGFTVTEIQEQTGRDPRCIRRDLKAAIESGAVECVYEMRTGIDRVTRRRAAYRPVKGKKK